MHSCLALEMAELGVGDHHSERYGARDPPGRLTVTGRLPQPTCIPEVGPTVGPVGWGERSPGKAKEAVDLNATTFLGCYYSDYEEHRVARGTHQRLGAVGYSSAGQAHGGYARSARDLTVR